MTSPINQTEDTYRKVIWKFTLRSKIGPVQKLLLPHGAIVVNVDVEPNKSIRIDPETGRDRVVVWVELNQYELLPMTYEVVLLHTGDEVPGMAMYHAKTFYANPDREEVIHAYVNTIYEDNPEPVADSSVWGLVEEPTVTA